MFRTIKARLEQLSSLASKSKNFNFDSNISRFTQYKTLPMSKNNPLTPILLARKHVTSYVKCYIDRSCINWKDIDGVKKSITLLYMTFPKRLENSANILPPSLYLPYFIWILLLKEGESRITALSWHLQNSFLFSTGLQIGLQERELKKSTLTLRYIHTSSFSFAASVVTLCVHVPHGPYWKET